MCVLPKCFIIFAKYYNIKKTDTNKNDIVSDLLKQYDFVEFFVGKKNKDKIINKFCEVLNINEEKAEDIYNKVMEIISTGIKDKILHPFKSQD